MDDHFYNDCDLKKQIFLNNREIVENPLKNPSTFSSKHTFIKVAPYYISIQSTAVMFFR